MPQEASPAISRDRPPPAHGPTIRPELSRLTSCACERHATDRSGGGSFAVQRIAFDEASALSARAREQRHAEEMAHHRRLQDLQAKRPIDHEAHAHFINSRRDEMAAFRARAAHNLAAEESTFVPPEADATPARGQPIHNVPAAVIRASSRHIGGASSSQGPIPGVFDAERRRLAERLAAAHHEAPEPTVAISYRPGFGYDSGAFSKGNPRISATSARRASSRCPRAPPPAIRNSKPSTRASAAPRHVKPISRVCRGSKQGMTSAGPSSILSTST